MTDTSGGGNTGEEEQNWPPSGGRGYPPPAQPSYPGQQQPPLPPSPSGPPPPSGPPLGAPPYGTPPPPFPSPSGYPGQPPAYGVPQAPAYPGYPGGYGPGDERKPGWSGLAIAAFVTAILLPCVGLVVAVPLAIVALVQIKRTRDRGKGLAISAIVIALAWLAVAVAVIVWAVSTDIERDDSGQIVDEGRIGFSDIRPGDCVNIPDPSSEDDVNTFELKGVPCADPHNAEAVTVIAMGIGEYPGFETLGRQSLQECQQAVNQVIGDQQGYQSYRLVPTEGIWTDDDGHRVLCFVTRSGFADMTGSVGD